MAALVAVDGGVGSPQPLREPYGGRFTSTLLQEPFIAARRSKVLSPGELRAHLVRASASVL